MPESELWWMMDNNDPVASSSLSNVRGSAQLEPNVIFELLLHATAEWSEARLEDNAKDVEAELLEAFRQACTPIDIPPPQDSSTHRWR